MRSGSRTKVVTVIAAVLVLSLACAAQAPAEPSADNPAPSISSLSPAVAATGGAEFTLTVTGLGFVAASQVYWNGEARPTVFVSTTQLQAQIAAGDIAADQTAAVTVVQPGARRGHVAGRELPRRGARARSRRSPVSAPRRRLRATPPSASP